MLLWEDDRPAWEGSEPGLAGSSCQERWRRGAEEHVALRGRGWETVGMRWAGRWPLLLWRTQGPRGLGWVGGSLMTHVSCALGHSSLRASLSSLGSRAWGEEKMKRDVEEPRTVPGTQRGSIIRVSLRGTGTLQRPLL